MKLTKSQKTAIEVVFKNDQENIRTTLSKQSDLDFFAPLEEMKVVEIWHFPGSKPCVLLTSKGLEALKQN